MARRRRDGFDEIDWSRFTMRDLPRIRRPRGPEMFFVAAVVLFLVLLLIPLLLRPIVTFLTDVLWFRSVGLEAVYLRRYVAALGAFAVFFFAFFAFAAANVLVALRSRVAPVVIDVGRQREPITPLAARATTGALLVLAFFFGLAAAAQWEDLLKFVNATPFGATDALFGQDISFYFFTLPVFAFVRGWLIAAFVVVGLAVLLAYLGRGAQAVATAGRAEIAASARAAFGLARPARAHLSLLAAGFLLLVAAGYQLDRYELLFLHEGHFLTGAGYTSVNARLPALAVLTVIAVIAAALLVANVRARTLWLLGATLGAWILAAVVVGGVYPALVDRFIVQPAQLERERPFIERHIAATRGAYGIDRIQEEAFDVKDEPTQEDFRRDSTAIENVRLWDYRPLQETFSQIQTLRQYYEFPDVDVTRVTIDGRVQQLMVAARELDERRVPQQWVNLHLLYTHGYGAVGTQVAGVTPEGQPALTLKDFPPQGQPRIERPQIYYGQLTGHYVIVGTSTDEIDYPRGGADETTRFNGGGGIGVSGLWDRFLFALRFGDINLLISSQLGSESRLLMHRQIEERERLIAPFLLFDRDPYLAFADGRLFWIHDAYTTGDRYPYAEAFDAAGRPGAEGLGTRGMNYIRNSVKITTDAYDGTIRFYIADPSDPVVRTWAKIFPELFRPLEEIPAALRAQLRYPEDIFRMQAAMYGRYHVTDPDVFFNNSDEWQMAREIFEQGGVPRAIEPYYVITRLPGSERAEFLLFVPMTPSRRDNMVGWLAGRSDDPNYGQLRALRFATDRTIFGPLQIENRIDADPAIKNELALLTQAGTSVERGNLLVIPVGNSFLYVEPIFIKARTATSIPQLRRIVLATQTRVVMADTFARALALIFGAEAPAPPPPPVAQPPPGTASPEIATLVRSASDHYAKAQTALRAGDFATYGAELAALERDLARLREITGVP